MTLWQRYNAFLARAKADATFRLKRDARDLYPELKDLALAQNICLEISGDAAAIAKAMADAIPSKGNVVRY